MIRKEGSKYTVYSEDGSKRLSKPGSKQAASKRLREIEYFKHAKKSLQTELRAVDTSASDLTLQTDSKKAKQANRINETTSAYKSIKKANDDGQGGTMSPTTGAPTDDRYLLAEARSKTLKDKTGNIRKSLNNYGTWIGLNKKYKN